MDGERIGRRGSRTPQRQDENELHTTPIRSYRQVASRYRRPRARDGHRAPLRDKLVPRRTPHAGASMSRAIRSLASFLVMFAAPLAAQQVAQAGAATSAARSPALAADWAKWETLGNGDLSPDGAWVAYDFRRANGTGELLFRKVGSYQEELVHNGTGATFSSNSRWLIYTIMPDTAGGRRAGRGGRATGAGSAA